MATGRRKARKQRHEDEKRMESAENNADLCEMPVQHVDNAKNVLYYRPDIAESDDEEVLLLLM